jgi:histidinol-phosphate aminotransferase
MEEMLGRPYAIDSPDTKFLPGINRYPDFLNVELTELFAKRHHVLTGNVVPTCGISEICYMCSQAFLGPKKHLLTPEVTFPLLAHYAKGKAVEVRTAPMNEHAVDLAALLDAIDPNTGMVYLANPNNPTGSLLSYADLEAFAHQAHRKSPETVLFIDEAYMEYVLEEPPPEAAPLVYGLPVLVGRTFSKAFGLAGLRVGYLVGHEDLVLILNGFLGGYLGGDMGWRMFEGNVNRMATAAAQGSLTPEGLSHLGFVRDRNAVLRAYLADALAGQGYPSLPSHANFLLVSLDSEGENLRRYLCSREVLVQAGGSFHPGYGNWLRVSVGDQEEIDAFLEALSGYDPSRSYPPCFSVYYHGI